MRTLLLALFLCLFSGLVVAQNAVQPITIGGTVIDSAINKPMGFVTVAVQDAKTHNGVKSSLTKDDGTFSIKAPAGNTYEIVFVFVGYRNKIIPVNSAGNTIDVGKITLSPSSSQLKEVSVTAARPLLTVDGNDNIKLKGSGNYKILINGKESAMVAKNPSDILKSMPATNIEKIEVITTPPAKYDAEGLSGIINIITKKNADQGYNIGLNTRFNSVFGNGYNLNGTLKQGKFGLAMYAGFGSNGNLTNTLGSNENIF